MATAYVISCNICMHEYNDADHKSVALPCGHDFCLTCLVHLKPSGSHKCPKCGEDWAELEVEALPGMEEVEEAVDQQRDEEEALPGMEEVDQQNEEGDLDERCMAKKTLARPEGPLSDAAFIRGLLKASKSSVELLTEALRAAEEPQTPPRRSVDSSNSEAALLALAGRQLSILSLTVRPDEAEAPPEAAVSKAALGCEVRARFLDSFLRPEDTSRDLARLEEITKHPSLRTTHFYGHLNKAGITKLPHSVMWLGLAICSAADARAVSDLRPWTGLWMLGVSVSGGVAARDLRRLPSVQFTELFFPGLTDARVDSVRPAIEALVPGERFSSLCLPESQLTGGGIRRLARLLHGLVISDCVQIETNYHWVPGEKDSVEDMFCSAVQWGMSSLYGS